MENKKQNSTGKTVAIIILVGLLVCSLGYIAYDKFLYNVTEEETNKEETSNKKENLDVNSRLVQGLYRKVSTGETSKDNSSCTFNYMYENKDFYADKAEEKQKMLILSRLLLDDYQKLYIGDESLIPDRISDLENYISVFAASKNGSHSYSSGYYNKEYIEELYKELYGKNASLDTSASIGVGLYNCTLYKYIKAVDKYILYINEFGCGGTCGPINEYATLTKAEKMNKEIKIYEKVTSFAVEDFDGVGENDKTVSYKKDQVISEDNYIYTFKLEDDGMYSFYSRVKES